MSENLNESVSRSLRLNTKYDWYNQAYNDKGTKSTSSSVSWVETRTGSQNPRWRDLVRLQREAGTTYSRDGHLKYKVGSFRATISSEKFYGYSTPNRFTESLDMDYLTLPGWVVTSTNVYNIALGNFLQNVNGALSPFKGMVFLGELRETLKMLRRPASALRDGFSAYIQSARRHVRRQGRPNRSLRKILSDSWLEYCYGWRPLIGDIEGATKAYLALDGKTEQTFVSGESSANISASSVTSPSLAHYNYFYIFTTVKEVKKDKVKFKGMVLHRLSDLQTDSAHNVISLSGFRLEEFIPTVWELVPYSFIIDYFSNIGDILNSISAVNADLAWKSCSRWSSVSREESIKLDSQKVTAFLTENPAKGKLDLTEGGQPSQVERMNYSRFVPVLTVPSLVLHLPSSPWQWVNLAALLSSKS